MVTGWFLFLLALCPCSRQERGLGGKAKDRCQLNLPTLKKTSLEAQQFQLIHHWPALDPRPASPSNKRVWRGSLLAGHTASPSKLNFSYCGIRGEWVLRNIHQFLSQHVFFHRLLPCWMDSITFLQPFSTSFLTLQRGTPFLNPSLP